MEKEIKYFSDKELKNEVAVDDTFDFGVVPLPIKLKDLPTFRNSQCSGISPSHSMPESFSFTFGFSPLVTAWLMIAARCSLRRSISFCLFSMRVSISFLISDSFFLYIKDDAT